MARPMRMTLNSKSLSLIGIPKKFHKISLQDFDTFGSDNLRKVRNFVSGYIQTLPEHFSEGAGIFFTGSNGVGKTMLSCIIAKEAYRYRFTVRRCTFVEYMTVYTSVWNAKTSEEKDICEAKLFDYYKSVELLILEEIGKEVDSKAAAPILEDLLRYRDDEGLVTIMCSNLKPSVLEERYGTSCLSLVKGSMIPITIESTDRRKKEIEQ